jgi:hypothetical protein
MYLGAQSADLDYKNVTVPLLQGLKETGYVEGQNVAIEYCWADRPPRRDTDADEGNKPAGSGRSYRAVCPFRITS